VQPAQLATALEEVAARLGIQVRYDEMDPNHPPGAGAGGFCRVHGRPMILLDAKLAPRDRVAVLAHALGRFDLDGIFLAPLVRATIHSHADAAPLEPCPLARTVPPDGDPGDE